MKALSQIQLDFDKRVKEAETKYTDRLQEIKKQLDHRWRQIDKFEASVKTFAEAKATWRRKLGAKEGELDTAKASLSALFCCVSRSMTLTFSCWYYRLSFPI